MKLPLRYMAEDAIPLVNDIVVAKIIMPAYEAIPRKTRNMLGSLVEPGFAGVLAFPWAETSALPGMQELWGS